MCFITTDGHPLGPTYRHALLVSSASAAWSLQATVKFFRFFTTDRHPLCLWASTSYRHQQLRQRGACIVSRVYLLRANPTLGHALLVDILYLRSVELVSIGYPLWANHTCGLPYMWAIPTLTGLEPVS